MAIQPLPKEPASAAVPVHVAIIMDGNRRWARARGMPALYGHQRGAEAVRRTVRASADEGIRYLTLFAFSSENWRRPAGEVGDLMNLLRLYLRREIDELHRNDVKLRFIGESDGLAPDLQALIHQAETQTACNTGLIFTIALNYGGRAEIARAARRLAKDAVAGTIAPDAIDEQALAQRLDTAGMPDPDLLIRTSGEQRISNFLLWQLAYAELVFLDVSWPDFSEVHLREAVAQFAQRDRRYGSSSS